MSEPFMGELRIVSFSFPPKGWAFCDGQLLPINQNQALFALLGTTYGGNGQTNFALPNLRGRIPVHFGVGFTLGQNGGETSHTLTTPEMAAHTHPAAATTTVGSPGLSPSGAIPGPGPGAIYAASSNVSMRAGTVTSVGGNQPHANEAPYLVLSVAIALQGIFPSQN